LIQRGRRQILRIFTEDLKILLPKVVPQKWEAGNLTEKAFLGKFFTVFRNVLEKQRKGNMEN
jgi:hypothetical protein